MFSKHAFYSALLTEHFRIRRNGWLTISWIEVRILSRLHKKTMFSNSHCLLNAQQDKSNSLRRAGHLHIHLFQRLLSKPNRIPHSEGKAELPLCLHERQFGIIP